MPKLNLYLFSILLSLLSMQSIFSQSIAPSLLDITANKVADMLLRSTPQQIQTILTGIPEYLHDKLKSTLINKYKLLFIAIFTLTSRVLQGHALWVKSVAFSSDGRYGLTGSEDHTARLWDVATLQSRILQGHTDCVSSVAFSPDGRYALTGSNDNTARLWDIVTLQSRVLEGHTGWVRSVAFSPDGRFALTGSKDNTARLWDVATLKSRVLQGHTGWVTSVAFSSDGTYALTGSNDDTARLWDLATLQSTVLRGHTSNVTSVAFSPDGKYALTGSNDYTARLWDLTGYLQYVDQLNLEQVLFFINVANNKRMPLDEPYYKNIIQSLSVYPVIKTYIDSKMGAVNV